jgi:hypothetical protein
MSRRLTVRVSSGVAKIHVTLVEFALENGHILDSLGPACRAACHVETVTNVAARTGAQYQQLVVKQPHRRAALGRWHLNERYGGNGALPFRGLGAQRCALPARALWWRGFRFRSETAELAVGTRYGLRTAQRAYLTDRRT